MNSKESIKESIKQIKIEYLDNIKNGSNWVALESRTALLLEIAKKELDSNDELITDIENTLTNISER